MRVGRIFIKNIYLFIIILGFFQKPEKLGSHTGSNWWPGDPDVKDDPNDPLTRRPNDPVPCLKPTPTTNVCCRTVGSWRRVSGRRVGSCWPECSRRAVIVRWCSDAVELNLNHSPSLSQQISIGPLASSPAAATVHNVPPAAFVANLDHLDHHSLCLKRSNKQQELDNAGRQPGIEACTCSCPEIK